MFQLLLGIIYLSFISLGLPDGLLGAAWPSIYPEFHVPVSYAGIVSMLISAGTVVSSLMSDRLTRKLGTGKLTAISVGMTAAALLGFSCSNSFFWLLFWAIPYGLGAGSVDASLNNYVALHYESRHMSWLHCMWGIGAATGPYIMAAALTTKGGWHGGYRYVGLLQIALTLILVCSLKQWQRSSQEGKALQAPRLSARQILGLPGAKQVLLCFFCYCALEATTGLWASSYLVLLRGVAAREAASFAGLFYLGITGGRAISGFLTMRFSDTQMVRIGLGIIGAGLGLLLVPLGREFALVGLLLVGLGCAPVYPCIIHATPAHFGAENSQALIGFQMATAYVGTTLMPPLFGVIANRITVALFPFYLAGVLLVMSLMHEGLVRKAGA